MLQIVSKAFFAIFMLGLTLIFSACSSGVPTQDDIPPMTPVEAQPVSETPAANQADSLPVEIPAPETSPISTPEPTPTDLPTEMAEPISPLALPVLEPTLASIPRGVLPPVGSETSVAAAIADLSKQTSVPADQISLTSVEPMEWSDASLGCPQEGMMYAQVITPGYLIVLTAQGQQYEYHTDQKANVTLCNK